MNTVWRDPIRITPIETAAAAPKMAQAIDSLFACPATAAEVIRRGFRRRRLGRRPAIVRGTPGAELLEQAGGELAVVLAEAVVALGGEAEAHAHPRALRESARSRWSR